MFELKIESRWGEVAQATQKFRFTSRAEAEAAEAALKQSIDYSRDVFTITESLTAYFISPVLGSVPSEKIKIIKQLRLMLDGLGLTDAKYLAERVFAWDEASRPVFIGCYNSVWSASSQGCFDNLWTLGVNVHQSQRFYLNPND